MLLGIKESVLVLVSNVYELTNLTFLALNPYVLKKYLSLIGNCVGTKDQIYALLLKLLSGVHSTQ